MSSLALGRPTRLAYAMPWFVGIVALIVYANALQNGFVLDDEGVILRNPLVQGIDGVWRAFAHPYWPSVAGQYRPLVISSFAAEWPLWTTNAAGYHAINVLLHALVSVLVYLFARRWLSLAGAAIAGFAFALHPVHVEAVANIIGRAELMAAAGILAMLLLHERRSMWAVAAFAAGLFSKEHALVAPVLALMVDAIARPPRRREARKGAAQGDESKSRVVPLYVGYAGVAMVWLAAVVWLFHDTAFAAVDPLWRSMDWSSRVLTMLGAVPTWVRLWFWPFELSADYSPQVTVPWPANQALAMQGAALIVGAAMLAVATWRRAPHLALALLWIGIAVLPVANILVPTGIIVAERTLYIASVGAVLLIGAAGEWVGRRRAGAAIVAAIALGAAFALHVWTRTPVWQSNRSLLLATLASHPEASATHLFLARVHTRTGDHNAALAAYRVSLGLFAGNPVVWAEAIEAAGRSATPDVADSLVRSARVAVGGSYLVSAAHAAAAIGRHRYAEALRAAREVIAIAPDSVRGYDLASRAWLGLGQPDSARAELRRAPPGDVRAPRADSAGRSSEPDRMD